MMKIVLFCYSTVIEPVHQEHLIQNLDNYFICILVSDTVFLFVVFGCNSETEIEEYIVQTRCYTVLSILFSVPFVEAFCYDAYAMLVLLGSSCCTSCRHISCTF